MNTSLHVTCPGCGQINRLPAARLGEQPRCGRCKQTLLDGRVRSLDDDSLPTALTDNDLPLVIDFWAAWCGPCKTMAPVFAELAGRRRGQQIFAKLDTDAAPRMAARYGIRSIPTLIVFAAGRELARQSGALDATRLAQFIDQALRAR